MTDVRVFATVPPPAGDGGGYRAEVRRASQLSEAAGCYGALIYSDNRSVDPWLVAAELVLATRRLSPLIAVQPLYLHPYALAKKIASFGLLYGRRVCLNLIAGGNRTDLAALDDLTDHDTRYRRLAEYARVVGLLLDGDGPVTFEGEHYRVRALSVFPALPRHLRPELYISGSSEAGRQVGQELGAVPVSYPVPPGGTGTDSGPREGVRLGIIARDSDEEAWRVARARFPETRAGQMLRRMARRASDSQWFADLAAVDEFPAGPHSPYWMGPFRNYASFCPYLVGRHEKVTAELARYIAAGCHTYIVDTAREERDYADTEAIFDLARRRAATRKDREPAPINEPARVLASGRARPVEGTRTWEGVTTMKAACEQ